MRPSVLGNQKRSVTSARTPHSGQDVNVSTVLTFLGRRARATRPVAQLLRRRTRRGRYNLWPRRWLITCGAAYSRVLEPLGYVSFETRFTLCASSGSAPGAAETWDGYLNDINGTYVTESWATTCIKRAAGVLRHCDDVRSPHLEG